MKTLLICHEGADLDAEGLSRWLHSWSELTGIVVLRETGGRTRQRIRREIRRSGWLRFVDVLAFRLYYKLRLAKRDAAWEQTVLERLRRDYPDATDTVPTLETHSINSKAAQEFIEQHRPAVMIARCKTLIKESIFSLPTVGTFVFHPGLCPEYRNAHGCFWALANGEPENVAMTVLKIDAGVDTGPVYGYFGCDYDGQTASHIEIQQRTVFDNLAEIRTLLERIVDGKAQPIDTTGRNSAVWGQPWLTKYLGWKNRGRRNRDRQPQCPDDTSSFAADPAPSTSQAPSDADSLSAVP